MANANAGRADRVICVKVVLFFVFFYWGFLAACLVDLRCGKMQESGQTQTECHTVTSRLRARAAHGEVKNKEGLGQEHEVVVVGKGWGWKGRTEEGQKGILNRRKGCEGKIRTLEKLGGTKTGEMGGMMKVRR